MLGAAGVPREEVRSRLRRWRVGGYWWLDVWYHDWWWRGVCFWKHVEVWKKLKNWKGLAGEEGQFIGEWEGQEISQSGYQDVKKSQWSRRNAEVQSLVPVTDLLTQSQWRGQTFGQEGLRLKRDLGQSAGEASSSRAFLLLLGPAKSGFLWVFSFQDLLFGTPSRNVCTIRATLVADLADWPVCALP